MPSTGRSVRIGLLLVVLALLAPTAVGFATGPLGTESPVGTPPNGTVTTTPTASPDGPTRSTNGTGKLVYVVDAAGPGQLTVLDRTTGDVTFTTSAHQLYHDVDPSPAGTHTLTYVASDIKGDETCPEAFSGTCTRDVIERVNYTTGHVERLDDRLVNYNGSSNIHDVDRISETEFLVADIQFDRIYVLNVTTGEVEWTWNVSTAYDRSTGGRPDDWTHVNDIEVVEPGLYMVNLRNQDQVVFVDRERGLLENMTLGSDGSHQILYEAHNPDYIPPERGGPAILVADSENNRVVEYQRRNGSWERTWLWTDEHLQWPRDADRLPNNNTLVVDSHGARILEVAPNGTVVDEWSVPRGVYEAELLGTGPESEGGLSMAHIRGGPADPDVSRTEGPAGALQKAVLGLFPPLVLHGVLFVLPTWVSPLAGGLLLVDAVVVGLWGLAEGGRFLAGRYRSR